MDLFTHSGGRLLLVPLGYIPPFLQDRKPARSKAFTPNRRLHLVAHGLWFPQIQVALLIEDAPTPAPKQMAAAAPAPAPAAEPVPTKLPKTGSPVPLVGLLGLLSLSLSFGVRMLRRV